MTELVTRRKLFVTCAAIAGGAGLALTPLAATAQGLNYPTRTIKAVVPYPAGGMSDVSSRAVMERLSQELGQPIVIENKGGAASTLASNWFMSQAADGYTLYAAPVSADKELADKLARMGVQLKTSIPSGVLAAMDRDEALWGQIIREQGIQE